MASMQSRVRVETPAAGSDRSAGGTTQGCVLKQLVRAVDRLSPGSWGDDVPKVNLGAASAQQWMRGKTRGQRLGVINLE